jgi:hypothetical protein
LRRRKTGKASPNHDDCPSGHVLCLYSARIGHQEGCYAECESFAPIEGHDQSLVVEHTANHFVDLTIRDRAGKQMDTASSSNEVTKKLPSATPLKIGSLGLLPTLDASHHHVI